MTPTIDARQLPDGTTINTDLCIVGAGAMGIAISLQFKDTTQHVCLIESGDLGPDEATQSLYDFENVGYPIRQTAPSRIRYFGGTTNVWTGRCLPLDAIDFEKREWVANSGWPIDYNTLRPYFQRAAALFKLPDYRQIQAAHWPLRHPYKSERQIFASPKLTPVVSLRRRTSLNFRTAYRQDLQRASNIQIYLNANVIEVEATESLNTIRCLRLACLNGLEFRIKAKVYILACGGLENARILLLSRHQNTAGLGNEHDVVGRYYMDHPKVEHGILKTAPNFNAPLLFGYRTLQGTTQFGIRLSDAVQRRERILNHYILLQPQFVWNGDKSSQGFGLGGKLRYFYRKLTQQPLRHDFLQIKNYLEQVPRRESRVTLSRQRDKLGLQQLQLHWQVGKQEAQDLYRFHGILRQCFSKPGDWRYAGIDSRPGTTPIPKCVSPSGHHPHE